MESYDVVVVGAGTGGQTAAHHLRQAGLKVALAEKSDLPGGVCALAGCQAKKWFYEAAEIVARSRHLEGKGMTAAAGDWGAVRAEKNRFTEAVPDSTVEGLYGAGIDYLEGAARFTDPHTLTVDGAPVQTRFVVLATGACPMPLPIPGASHLVLSDAFLQLPALPRRIVFVGGGFISFEFAHFAARLGAEKGAIHILEAADRTLGPFDAEMVDLLVDASAREGIAVHTGDGVVDIRPDREGFIVTTASGRRLEADLVVHGAGRVADVEGLDPAAAGIAISNRGIVVDEQMRTSNPNVFAVGDCAATVQLARVADFEAAVAARCILAEMDRGDEDRMDYRFVPSLLFTYPQYAMVGATEEALKHSGTDYLKSFGKNLRWPTYRRVGLETAAYKILADPKGTLLGAHFISDNASGLVNAIRLAMVAGLTAEDLHRHSIMGPYPSRESDLLYMLAPLVR
ncbi:MAG: NAD(P)/FAD-dependent oxidoreductase [Desulfobacterales bacterium]|nr:NAD(P)/FAD-dependent oxidoreductase [Desulfobacterales bacterium]